MERPIVTFHDDKLQISSIDCKIVLHDYYDLATNRECFRVEYEGPYNPELISACVKRIDKQDDIELNVKAV